MTDKPQKRNEMSDMVHRIKANNSQPLTEDQARVMTEDYRKFNPGISDMWNACNGKSPAKDSK